MRFTRRIALLLLGSSAVAGAWRPGADRSPEVATAGALYPGPTTSPSSATFPGA